METKVDAILRQKKASSRSEQALFWALANGILAFVLFYDISVNGSRFSMIVSYEFLQIAFWYVEAAIAILFCWNTIFDLWLYIWPSIGMQSVDVLPVQKMLFGIKDEEPGFSMSTPKKTLSPNTSLQGTPELLTSFVQSPYQIAPIGSYSPVDYSATSWNSSYLSGSPNLSTSCSSWNYYPDQPSFNSSYEAKFFENPDSSLHKRASVGNTPNNSFSTLQDHKITDEKSLDKFINSYATLEQKAITLNKDNHSPINYAIQNNSPQFTWKFQYQPACRSPQSSALSGDADSQISFSGDMVWGKLKISEDSLSGATENLRKWLNQTILNPVVAEIESINETLSRLGSSDLQIGEVSLSTLRQINTTKGQHLPTLPTMIPYLELSVNQEYLVKRLKELSRGGCMSEFHWNGGGTINGKPWTDELPTDSAIVMHVFCSYLDSRLPPHPNYPDGKTFSTQHFQKAPVKPVFATDSLFIYQSKLNPPHYKLAIGEELWDIPKGRNNMFFTILLFLQYVKVNRCGMLGRINLGASGINILWVVDNLKN